MALQQGKNPGAFTVKPILTDDYAPVGQL